MEEIKVSEKVLTTFQTAFPAVDLSTVNWGWEVYNKIVEADFELDDVSYEVEITVTGHHLLTEKEIAIEDIPDNVMEVLKTTYPHSEIVEAELVTWSTGEVFYELDMNNDDEQGEDFEIHITPEGEITAVNEDL